MADEAEVAADPLERDLAPWGRVIYSLATLALPLLMFLAMMAVIKGLFTDAYMEQLTKAVETEDSWTSYGQLVAQQKAALAIAGAPDQHQLRDDRDRARRRDGSRAGAWPARTRPRPRRARRRLRHPRRDLDREPRLAG